MRQRRKYQLRVRERGIIVSDEANLGASQARAFPPLFVCGRKDELHVGVPRNDCAEFATGVAAGTQDTDRNSMHE